MSTPVDEEESALEEVQRYAICHTPGCPNAESGEAFLVTLYVLGEGVLSACQCGLCGNRITDLQTDPPSVPDSPTEAVEPAT